MSLILTERHEPEPVEFARLIQHLERGEIPACRADACGQDPSRCPCPAACQLGDAESMAHYRRARVVLIVAFAATAAAVLLAVFA